MKLFKFLLNPVHTARVLSLHKAKRLVIQTWQADLFVLKMQVMPK